MVDWSKLPEGCGARAAGYQYECWLYPLRGQSGGWRLATIDSGYECGNSRDSWLNLCKLCAQKHGVVW